MSFFGVYLFCVSWFFFFFVIFSFFPPEEVGTSYINLYQINWSTELRFWYGYEQVKIVYWRKLKYLYFSKHTWTLKGEVER